MMSLFHGSIDHRFTAVARQAATRIEPLLPVAIFVVMVAAARWWGVYQLDSDEGLNLMKGALVANGFSLYSEIWSDQPPILTLILAAVQRVFPFNVDAARTVVLAFSGLLLWSLFRSIRRLEGRGCAWLAVAALMAISFFQKLSVSVMIGLPALALASAAMDCTLAGASGDRYWRYLLAGALFALALQTKLFVALVFPALALAACIDADGRLTTLRIGLARLACLVLGIASVFIAIKAAVGEPLVAQLVVPHYRASAMPGTGGIAYFLTLLTRQVPVFVFFFFCWGSWHFRAGATPPGLFLSSGWYARSQFWCSIDRSTGTNSLSSILPSPGSPHSRLILCRRALAGVSWQPPVFWFLR